MSVSNRVSDNFRKYMDNLCTTIEKMGTKEPTHL